MGVRSYLYQLATDKQPGFIAAIFKVFLFVFSLIYSLIIRALILFYRLKEERLNCKVISVGNITLGGTGKTTLVAYIAQYLAGQGRKVAILSRGYKRWSTRAPEHQSTRAANLGDEPYMLQMKLRDVPVIVDANRVRAAKRAIGDFAVDTVILDDGFQQWGIRKDLEIVSIDAANPFGNRQMLPRGILREPLSSLKRADVAILTKTNLGIQAERIKERLHNIKPSLEIFESAHEPLGFYCLDKPDALLGKDLFQGKKVAAFSGIADPDSFEKLLQQLGVSIALSFRFPDHHWYSSKDLEDILNKSQEKNIDIIVTTEKDAARLKGLPFDFAQGRQITPRLSLPRATSRGSGQAEYRLQILVLRIGIKILQDENKFLSRLSQLYSL